MTQVTGVESKTLHRLLEVEWGKDDAIRFRRNEKNLLKCDALIIDEVSMVDSILFESVLRALPLGCKLILVGDSDQLPSVGPGNILGDLIKSNILPTVQLREIFRQSIKSLIVMNAHRVVNGEIPLLTVQDNDFFFLNMNNSEQIKDTIIDLCCRRLPKAYGYSPIYDIQVICPSKKGVLGTINFNVHLQDKLNPPSKSKAELNINGLIFRQGDKVMQVKNDYDIEFTKDDGTIGEGVFNGDVGILISIDRRSSTFLVKFDDKTAMYNMENAFNLELAYAITVHKSQGNEFEAVIIPTFGGSPKLYYRNLLYTAITRAKNLLILAGSEGTITRMVENNRKTKRYTCLYNFLVGSRSNERS